MPTARDLRTADRRTLRDALVHGHPVDPRDIEGFAYRGTSLGLPRAVQRLTWTTFQKTFYRDPTTGRLLGWNVRLCQDGIDAPSRPRRSRGRPVTEWHYEVVPAASVPMPPGFDRGLAIDYGLGANPKGIMTYIKDPLVALSAGSADELLGVSYLTLGGACLETPTYFTLVRDHRLDFVPYDAPPRPRLDPLRLTARERALAEVIFASLLAGHRRPSAGVPFPPFARIDTRAFWDRFDSAPPPLVRAGLRPMIHTINLLPRLGGYGRSFTELAPYERERVLAEAARSRVYFVRQAVATLKTLACFAYFEDPAVRSRFEGGAA